MRENCQIEEKMKGKKELCVLSVGLCIMACAGRQSSEGRGSVEAKQTTEFKMPDIPVMLTTSAQRSQFMATHYWDNFLFSDSTLIGKKEVTEQAFSDFVSLLASLPIGIAEKGVDTMMTRAMVHKKMYVHFRELTERYLYNPNSPFRNEELYIATLKQVLRNPFLTPAEKERPQYQLRLILKNTVGEQAVDFVYHTPQGNKKRLYEAQGDRILLFFYRPDCENCQFTRKYIEANGLDRKLTIVWVNPDWDLHLDSLYDLRASPTLYLLDKDKKVLLKDETIEAIEQFLKG